VHGETPPRPAQPLATTRGTNTVSGQLRVGKNGREGNCLGGKDRRRIVCGGKKTEGLTSRVAIMRRVELSGITYFPYVPCQNILELGHFFSFFFS